MILLVSEAKDSAKISAALSKETGERCQFITGAEAAVQALRSGEFASVLVDQLFLDMHSGFSQVMWKHCSATLPVVVNFALSNRERTVRDLKAALDRSSREKVLAAKAAEAALRNELTGAISGILLSSELALAQPALPLFVINKLRSVRELAIQMKSRLEHVA